MVQIRCIQLVRICKNIREYARIYRVKNLVKPNEINENLVAVEPKVLAVAPMMDWNNQTKNIL